MTETRCGSCGHLRSQHSIGADGIPYPIIDNLTHGPNFYCDSRYQPDPTRLPWSSCGCMGWAEPALAQVAPTSVGGSE